jgi:hypothetical protein
MVPFIFDNFSFIIGSFFTGFHIHGLDTRKTTGGVA